jgi:hypothetical protein
MLNDNASTATRAAKTDSFLAMTPLRSSDPTPARESLNKHANKPSEEIYVKARRGRAHRIGTASSPLSEGRRSTASSTGCRGGRGAVPAQRAPSSAFTSRRYADAPSSQLTKTMFNKSESHRAIRVYQEVTNEQYQGTRLARSRAGEGRDDVRGLPRRRQAEEGGGRGTEPLPSPR